METLNPKEIRIGYGIRPSYRPRPKGGWALIVIIAIIALAGVVYYQTRDNGTEEQES